MANKKKEYYKPGPMTEGKRNTTSKAPRTYRKR